MDKRAILAFIFVGLILYFYDDYLRLVSPPPPPRPVDTTGIGADTVTPREPARPASETPSFSAAQPAVSPHLTTDGMTTPDESYQGPDLIVVETETARYVLTRKGARFHSVELKAARRYLPDPVELVPRAGGARPGFRFWTVDGPVETGNLNFVVEGDWDAEPELRLSRSQQAKISFLARFDSTRALRITYAFKGSDYTFQVEAEGIGMEGVWARDYVEALWTGGLAYTEKDTSQDHYYSTAYAYFAGNILEEQGIEAKEQVQPSASGKTRWGAVRSKYFIGALLPERVEADGAWLPSRLDSTYIGPFPPNRLGVGLKLPLAGSSPATPLRIYLGPLDDQLLKSVDPTLQKTLNWGWAIIAPFSKGILWGLKALHSMIPNYGVAVVIFSILIKLITWPLTAAQSRSMAGMQKKKPRMKALQEKYKNDRERLNREVMKLYKEEKVNPAGGCLPLLLQMPLLYALFMVFRSTIEFRQAFFMLWIDDLSMPDYIFDLPFKVPFYGEAVALLPILMAVSTYYQSKMTMTDPNQKMLLYMMPVMMLVFFNSLPSGLTLYYTLFNVLSLLQYKFFPPHKVEVKPA